MKNISLRKIGLTCLCTKVSKSSLHSTKLKAFDISMAAPYTAVPILLKCSTTDVTTHELITAVSAVSGPIEMIQNGKFLYSMTLLSSS